MIHVVPGLQKCGCSGFCCSLSVPVVAGAGVKVECINEGSLFINCTGSEQHAGQGDITVGSVKATTAVLMTTGKSSAAGSSQPDCDSHALFGWSADDLRAMLTVPA